MAGLEQIPWLYDAGMALAERGWLGRWRERLVAGLAGRVLEIGCGTGRNLTRYPAAARPVAVDPFAANLARARARAPGARLVQARAEALPFRDGAFRTAVSSLVLCSVDDPPRALAELRRVLEPAGELRAMEHVRARRPWAARLQDLAQPAWTAITGGCRPNRPTEATVAAAGFELGPDRAERGLVRRFTARPR
ncbi:MAG TPA: class I SAM-dependent methyltransferase [Anaeromyxobacteraceae bacterium]|nr:class I SAM-dependent methyltransferase [Anaeromyxobacteraceae bacterium]